MEKINRLLGRSKTFNSHDKKQHQRASSNKQQSNDTVPNEFDRSQKLALQPSTHLAKVSNPSDPQGTIKRFEKENLQRPKIKQITGLSKLQRNSSSSEDIAIRHSSANPKPARQERTKTMFDFFVRSKKSPLPTKKSAMPLPDDVPALAQPPPHSDNNNRQAVDTLPSGGSAAVLAIRKDSSKMLPLRRTPAELSSVEIDISDDAGDTIGFRRTYSRSMNDVMKEGTGSVKVLKDKFKEMPIMGRISFFNKMPNIENLLNSPNSKRRSSLPNDFKDLPAVLNNKRDQSMANNQQQGKLSNPSSTTKNSQHDLVPKSPVAKYGADFNSNEANQSPQKTSTNRKTIKHILQKFLSRRPTQQDLVTKGIIQEQRVFGNSLRRLCCTTATAAAAAAAANVGASAPRIPEFVATVVRMIEHERNVVSHGIYRASGNVATIQKIRVRVNEGKNVMDVLQDHKMDVDVLTGSLKLFFRELAEPLISTDMFTELCHLKGKDLTDPDQLYAEVDDIVRQQPAHHKDVLLALIRHILYVISFGDKNSMSIDSMSIVWGPSLIFTDNEEDGGTLLQRMTNNNSIVKFLLNVYSETFTRDTYIASKTHSESTLSLVSTSGKSSTTRASFKQQLSLDYTTSVEDIELLLKAIEKSECAKRINIYVNSKMKKSKKIIERIKAKKSIEKYFTSNDGLCGIVGALKFFVDQSKVVPAAFIGDYDGGTLHAKEIEAALDSLPGTNQQILTMLLNHLNLMANINPDKYSMELLVEAWTKHLFVNSEQTPNAGKYLEQLLIHNEQTANDRREQSTRQKIMLSDLNLNESFRMRGRVSGSDTSLDSEVLTICSGGDVEIRKSVKLHEKEEEQKRNNRNS